MEKEDGYDFQERTERVPTETSDREKGKEEHDASGKDYSRKTELLGYVRILWPYLVVIVFIFFGSLITGYASAASFPSMADTLMKGFSSRFGPLLTMSPLYIVLTIFLNNSFVSLLSLVLGMALGIFPILFIAFNGYFVGVISYVVGQQKGFLFILLALLPHGIIELPMVFLSASTGLRLGYQVFLYFIGRPTEIKKEFIKGLKFYFQVIMPLLFVAAIIETFITPIILSLVKGF
jgi:stage II sporulation protein M